MASPYQAVDLRNPWSPGWLSRMPWLGSAALVGCLAGLAASTGVMIYSDGKPIAQWAFQPATYIAIATVVTNLCLFYVLKEGANASWWQQASKKGTTIGDLHRNWAYGSSVQDALLSGKHFNFVALACLIATAAQINSPLLQRASRAVVEPLVTTTNLNLKIATEFGSTFYTGYQSGRAYAVSLFSEGYVGVVQNWNDNGTISMHNTGCQGICTGEVEGIGLALNCSSYNQPFNLNPAQPVDGIYDAGNDPAVNGTDIFETEFVWAAGAPGNLSVGVAYKDSIDCSGNLIVQNCTMHPARVRYKVIIDGNHSTIALDPSTTVFDDSVLEILDLPLLTTVGPTMIGGYWRALYNKYVSWAHLRFVGAVGYELITSGNLATQYAVVNGSRSDESSFSIGSSCDLTFRNPMNDLLSGARDLMFRTSLAATNDSTPVQTVTALDSQQRVVFQSDYAYLGGALAITLIALGMAAALFRGYHLMGRKTTMSPIEIAKAFNAPLLKSEDSNAEMKALIKELGARSVKYGVVARSRWSGEGSDGIVAHNGGEYEDYRTKAAYTTTRSFSNVGSARLEMADADIVRTPARGEKFVG